MAEEKQKTDELAENFDRMISDMNGAIESIEKTIAMQKRMSEILDAGITPEEKKEGVFKAFSDDLASKNAAYEEQLPILRDRVQKLKDLASKCAADENVHAVVEEFIAAIGMKF